MVILWAHTGAIECMTKHILTLIGGQRAYIRFKPSTSPATKEEVNKTLREKFPFVQVQPEKLMA